MLRRTLQVTSTNRKEYLDAAAVLKQAFKSDPVHQWFFKLVDDCNTIRSSSLWFDSVIPEWYEYLGLYPIAFRYPSAFYRLLVIQKLLDECHHRIMGNRPHWYLSLIGTDPECEGQGFGSQLMKTQLEIADKEGKESYLESSKETNIPFYEKFGFIFIEKVETDTMPPLFIMKRDPIP